MAKYESLQAILEEAGMSHQQLAETPYGTADGTNKIFTVAHKPLSDSNYDDAVTPADVLVLVNGVPATVSSVVAATGVITLASAPAADATLLIDYRYSPTTLEAMEQRRVEAQQWVDDAMKQAGDCAPYTEADFTNNDHLPHPTIRALTRLYAAAQLLIRDYGFNQDTELTSKDGFKKLELINGTKTEDGMLARFIATGGVCGGTGPQGVLDDIAAASDGDLFANDLRDVTPPNSDRCW